MFSPSDFHFRTVKMGEGGTRCEKSETENEGVSTGRLAGGNRALRMESWAKPSGTSTTVSPDSPQAHAASSVFWWHCSAPSHRTAATAARVPALPRSAAGRAVPQFQRLFKFSISAAHPPYPTRWHVHTTNFFKVLSSTNFTCTF